MTYSFREPAEECCSDCGDFYKPCACDARDAERLHDLESNITRLRAENAKLVSALEALLAAKVGGDVVATERVELQAKRVLAACGAGGDPTASWGKEVKR